MTLIATLLLLLLLALEINDSMSLRAIVDRQLSVDIDREINFVVTGRCARRR